MELFEFRISGHTDKDKDGNPDVTASASVAGFNLFKKTINLDLEAAMSLFFGLVGTARNSLGIGAKP